MKTLLLLLVAITTIVSAEFPHFGVVNNASGIPIAQAKVISKMTQDTVYTDVNGLFGSWPEATVTTVTKTIAEPTLFKNKLYLPTQKMGESISATLINVRGQRLWQYEGKATQVGLNTLPLDVSLATGFYILRLSVGEKKWIRKVSNNQEPKFETETAQSHTTTRESRELPFEDTLIVTAKGHVRTATIVPGGTKTAIPLALAPSTAVPVVSFASDTITVVKAAPANISVTATDATGEITTYYWRTAGVAGIDSTTVPGYTATFPELGERFLYCSVKNEYGDYSTVDSVLITVVEAGISLNAPDTITMTEDIASTIKISSMQISSTSGNETFTLSVLTGENYTVQDSVVTPDIDFNGELKIPVQVSDGTLLSNIDTIIATVTPVNDAPQITAITVDGVEVPVTNGEVIIPMQEIDNKVMSITYTDPEGDTPQISLGNSPVWVTSSSTDMTATVTMTPNSYDITPNGSVTREMYTITATDPGSALLTNVLSVYMDVSSVNRKPELSLPMRDTVQIGKPYSLAVSYSDPDPEDLLGLSTNDPHIVANGSTISMAASFDSLPESIYTLVVSLTDNIDTTTDTMFLYVGGHYWDKLQTIPNLVTITATNSSELFLLKDSVVDASDPLKGRYAVVEHWTNPAYRYAYNLPYNQMGSYTIKDMKQAGEKLYLNTVYSGLGGKTWTEIKESGGAFVSDTSYSDGTAQEIAIGRETGHIFVSGEGHSPDAPTYPYIRDPEFPGVNDCSPVGFTRPSDMKAARVGTNIFITSTAGGVYRKLNAGGQWKKVDIGAFTAVQFASDNGDSLYFISIEGKLHRCSDGRGDVTITAVPGEIASKNVSTVKVLNEKAAWCIANDSLYFSNDNFYTINRESKMRVEVKDVVISEDRKSIFAISVNGEIYRY